MFRGRNLGRVRAVPTLPAGLTMKVDAFDFDLPRDRIAQRPAVHEGEVVPRWLAVVSLTFDHRLVDGGPAARFLATLRELVESPVDLVA